MKDSFDMGSLIEEFRDEARDQVDRLDAGLLEIERTGGLEPESRSTLLRTLHTLKGNAGMMGLSEVRDYVHVLENALKSEIGAWPAGRIERLFEGAATLRSAVELAGRDGYEEAAGRLAGARHRLEEVESGGVESSDGAQSADTGDVGRDGATDVLRVPFPKLDALLAEVGELLGEADALLASVDGAGQERDLQDLAGAIRRRGDRLRDAAMALRLVPLGRVLSRFPALVRRLAREQEKEARVVLEGEATEVDKSTADALAEPLLHLVRNAVDHGVEPPEVRQREGKPRHGTITIRAAHRGDRVLIDVMDDGAGLPLDRILARARDQGLIEATAEPDARETAALIFRPGFTTRSEVSTVSGRGVGLDVVQGAVRGMRGEVQVEQRPEGGTRFRMSLPLTVAIVPSLIFEAAGETVALPATSIGRTLRVSALERVGRTEVIRDGETLVPVARADRLFGWPSSPGDGPFALVVRHGRRRAALLAERLVDQRDLVVKALPSYGGHVRGLSGASVMPGGGVILVLDAAELIEMNLERRERSTA